MIAANSTDVCISVGTLRQLVLPYEVALSLFGGGRVLVSP